MYSAILGFHLFVWCPKCRHSFYSRIPSCCNWPPFLLSQFFSAFLCWFPSPIPIPQPPKPKSELLFLLCCCDTTGQTTGGSRLSRPPAFPAAHFSEQTKQRHQIFFSLLLLDISWFETKQQMKNILPQKNHPPELSLAGERIGRFEGHIAYSRLAASSLPKRNQIETHAANLKTPVSFRKRMCYNGLIITRQS